MTDSNSKLSAYIDAGLLQSCTPDLPALYRDDVLNSMLLAQLAADKKFSRFSEVDAWYRFYGNTLSSLAWRASAFTFYVFQPAGPRFYLKDVIEKEFSKRVDPAKVEAVNSSIEKYNSLGLDSRARQVFSGSTQLTESDVELVNVQVAIVWGDAELSVVGAVFGTAQSITEILKEEIDSKLLQDKIQLVAYSGVLNETVYGGLRASVIEKLGRKREEFIVAIG
jgi:hypothetical protein